jgi:hypothetical protein
MRRASSAAPEGASVCFGGRVESAMELVQAGR